LFSPSVSSAQSSFLLISQGQIATQSTSTVAWTYNIRLGNGLTGTSTGAFLYGTIPSTSIISLGWLAYPTAAYTGSRIEFFSTTTISTYYPDSIRVTFLFLGACAIWVALIVHIYKRIVPHHITDTV